ncbi:hypothetical protein ACVKN2_003713 [Paenibacillus sp. PvR018]|nr:hypothetical protein [Paenibacillus sp. PvP091]MBP1171653.1 hypothetical protein [Paenibacillus sp. PvR098]MBP2438034.1 hypothetical protein [Paenibacillus sp. PvP052]
MTRRWYSHRTSIGACKRYSLKFIGHINTRRPEPLQEWNRVKDRWEEIFDVVKVQFDTDEGRVKGDLLEK